MKEDKISFKLAVVGSSKAPNSFKQDVFKTLDYFLDSTKKVISGGAKGIDTFAIEWAINNSIPYKIFWPKKKTWNGGFKDRNILIAKNCNALINFVLKNKNAFCYHCNIYGHEKSGGCFTMKEAGKYLSSYTVFRIELE